MDENKQPYFGDGANNNPGNNGYGFEEHEQYVNEPAPEPHQKNPDCENLNAYVVISPNDDLSKVTRFANKWHMHYAGEASFDDGEPIDDEHMKEITSIFYENVNPNHTKAFVEQFEKEFPHTNIMVSDKITPDDGHDMSRFGYGKDEEATDTDVHLDMDDLNDNSLER